MADNEKKQDDATAITVEEKEAYPQYINTRNEWYSLETAEQNKLDNYATIFSMAMIAASFTYYLQLSEKGVIFYVNALYSVWVLCFLSLASAYFSSFFSAKNAHEGLIELEKHFSEKHNVYSFSCVRYANHTRFFNASSLVCFVFALFSLVFFVYENPLGKIQTECPCVTELKK